MPFHSNSFGNEGIRAWLAVRSSLPYDFIIGGKKDNSAWADIKSETNVDLDELANNLVKKRMLRGDGLLGERSEDR